VYRKFIKEYVVYGAGIILSSGVGLLSMPIITRSLDKAEYGFIQLVSSLMTIFIPVVQLGLDSGIIYYFNNSKDSKDRRLYVSTYVTSYTVSSLLFGTIILSTLHFSMKYIPHEFQSIISLIIIFLIVLRFVINIPIMGIANILRLTFRQKHYIVVTNGLGVIYLIMVYMLWFLNKINLQTYFLAGVIPVVIIFPLSVYLIKNELKFGIDLIKLKKMFSYGFPVLFNQLLNNFKSNINLWLVYFVLGVTQTADYGFALKVSSVFSILGGAFRKTWAPFIFNIKDSIKAKQAIESLFIMVNIFFLNAITILNVVSPVVVSLVGSSKYMQTYNYIFPLGLNSMIALLNLIMVTSLGLKNKLSHYYWISPFSFFLMVSINYSMLKLYGINGLLVGSIISSSIMLVIYYMFTKSLFNIKLPFLKLISVNSLILILNILIVTYRPVGYIINIMVILFSLNASFVSGLFKYGDFLHIKNKRP